MFLTLSEAGRRIGQSRTTVRTMIKAGSIAGYIDPHSGRLRVRDSDVTDYLAKIDDITLVIIERRPKDSPLQNG